MFLFVLAVLGLLMVAVGWFQIRGNDKRPLDEGGRKLHAVPRR
jgi:hypothetical protein